MIVDALTGWTLFAGLVLSVGAVAGRWLVVPRAWPEDDGLRETALRRSGSVGLTGAVLVLVGLALYFVRQLLEFRDPFVPWTEDAALLLSTSWGTSWKAATTGAVVLVAAFPMTRTGARLSWWLVSPLALALAAFPGLTGHASGVEDGRTLALVADWSHVVAAGAWMGGLAVVLFLAWASRLAAGQGPGSDGPGPSTDLPRLIPAFSPVAMVSVAVLALSGSYAAWLHLPNASSLLTTDYGRFLMGKLVLVAVVLGLGARNFRILTPRLGSVDGDGAMWRSAAMELAVAQLVLLATALLVRTPPMGS